MARLESSVIRIINNLADFVVFLLAFIFGCLTRWKIDFFHGPLLERFDIKSLTVLFFVFYGTNAISMRLSGVYPVKRLRLPSEMNAAYSKSLFAALAAIMILAYLVFPLVTSRVLLLASFLYAFPLLLIKELTIRRLLSLWRIQGRNLINVLLVGEDEELIRDIRQELESNPMLGMRAIGVLIENERSVKELGGIPYLGSIRDLARVLEEDVIDCVLFLKYESCLKPIEDAMWECEERGVEVLVKIEILRRKISSVVIEHICAIPFLGFRTGPQDFAALMVKHALDRVLSAALLIILSPLFILVPILIKTTSPGPALFRQKRVGLNGRPFTLYKFRSMVHDAEAQRSNLASLNEMQGPVFKISEDPRITTLGKFLRKTSIDELPQLWNVLRGDMSLVGPRPLPDDEAKKIHGWHRRRLSFKPGITCIWQVEGRNRIVDFNDWVEMDLRYIDQWSLGLDFQLLLKTIPAVIFCRGAK